MMKLLITLTIAASTFAPWHVGTTARWNFGTLEPWHSPGSTPWMAARGDFVAVAWGRSHPEGGADVFLAVSRDSGNSFTSPVRVNARAGEARLGGELPPRVALAAPGTSAADPTIVVVWGAKAPATEIRMTRSTDGGRTFAPPTTLSAPGAAGDRGWHAVTLDSRGTPHVLWLDHRAMAARPKSTGHDHHSAGEDMSQFSSLYYAGGSTSGRERELAKGVCYCCKTALAIADDGTMFAAWRHVYAGNIRDIAFLASPDGGRTFSAPSRVSVDNWQLAGCPDDGPAMAIGSDNVAHVVWPTVIGGDTPRGALFYASTRDGQRFTTRVRVETLGSPKPSHPQIVVNPAGGLVIAWDEVINGVRQAAARAVRFNRDSSPQFGPIVRLDEGAASAYPIVVSTRQGLLAAWTRGVGPDSVVVVNRIEVPR